MIAAFLSQLWVQRLGWTLLHFLWQGTAIAVVYGMLRSVFGRWLSAQGRYLLACAALGAMVVAPPLTFVLIPNTAESGSWTISPQTSQWLLSTVVSVWVMGVLAFSTRLLGGWRLAARLRSTSHPASADWWRTLERIAARVGVGQPVRLLVSSMVDVPTVIGWLRPAILVPVEFLTGLPGEHITALLAHELAHIRRHDYLASVLQNIAEAVLFYHPAVWWLSEQIRAERELCCDDLAVAATGDVLAYARALAELESRQPARPTPALAANGGSLVNRVRRLIEPAQAIANGAPGPGAAWAMTLLWLAGLGVAAIHGEQTPLARVVAPVAVLAPVAAPSPLIALAGQARDTLLYDPLLSAEPPATRSPAPQRVQPQSRDLPNHDAESRVVTEPAADHSDEPASQQAPVIIAKSLDNELPMPVIAATPRSPAPVFRTATRLVQVDVIARNKGIPAAGLTSEDFTLLDNGRPRKIALFSVSSSQISGPAPAPLRAGVVSNRQEGGGEALENATVLLVDQKNTAQQDQAFAIQRIVKFLQSRRNRGGKPDRIGIYTFGGDGLLRVVQEVTDDAELLSQAAHSLKAQDPNKRDYDRTEMSKYAAMDTKLVLKAIARHVADIPGRKSLVWVTTSFPLVPHAGQKLDSGVNSLVEETARALNDANVALYAVDARGLVGALSGMTAILNAESAGPRTQAELDLQMHEGGGFLSGTDTMTRLADLTGGLVLYNANAIEDSIQKALDDSELSYTLGFYPAQEEQDGVWHRLKVQVAKRGVKVRYRGKYFASRTPVEANGRPPLWELLRGSLDATQLELVAETTPDRARPGSWQVRTSVDLHDVYLENQNHTWVGAVDVSFVLDGSATARTFTRKIEIPDAQLGDALEKGIAVDDSIALNGPAGELRGVLRVVAQDRSTGAAGSVRVPLIRR